MGDEKTNKWTNHNITAPDGGLEHESRIEHCIWNLKQVNYLLTV